MTRSFLCLVTLVICSLALMREAAFAQSLVADPITITLEHGAKLAAINLTNTSDQPIPIQARPFQWTQADGKDVLTPTQDAIISPPLATIAPGQTQVVRILVRQQPQGKEASYRILIDELPLPNATTDGRSMVHVVFRLSIPLFCEPGKEVAPALSWRILRGTDGKASLEVSNSGNMHSKFFNPVISTESGTKVKIPQSGTPYILAGSTRLWQIKATEALPPIDKVLHATASGNAGPITASVPVVAAP